MDRLPDELLLIIFNNIAVYDIAQVLCVNRKWYAIMKVCIEKNLSYMPYSYIEVSEINYVRSRIILRKESINEQNTREKLPIISFKKLIDINWGKSDKDEEDTCFRYQLYDDMRDIPKWWLLRVRGLYDQDIDSRLFIMGKCIEYMPQLTDLNITRETNSYIDIMKVIADLFQIRSIHIEIRGCPSINMSILDAIASKSENSSSGLELLTLSIPGYVNTLCDLIAFLRAAKFASSCRIEFKKLIGSFEVFLRWIQKNATDIYNNDLCQAYNEVFFSFRVTRFHIRIHKMVPDYLDIALEHFSIVLPIASPDNENV